MGAIRLTDELQHAIDRQVAEGRAASAAAFVEEAVLRLIEEARLEEAEITQVAQNGIADIEAGRFTMVRNPEDARRAHERWMARLSHGLAAEE